MKELIYKIKKSIKETLIFIILIQLLNTFLYSLSFFYRGKLSSGFYWLYVRNKVSFFGNGAGCKSEDSYKLTAPLVKDGFMETKSLSKETVTKLEKLFLDSQDKNYNSLQEYFDSKKRNNDVRPQGTSIALNKKIITKVFEELNILPKVKEYLGLSEKEIYFFAKIDCLININGTPGYKIRSDNALEFHRDIDSLTFVKAFCYLCDISEGFGEHEVCIGSHKKLPTRLRVISRFTHNDLLEKIPHLKLKPIYGNSGYSWLEDTTMFHRGTVPTKGNRLILSLSFNDAKSTKHMHEKEYYPLEI